MLSIVDRVVTYNYLESVMLKKPIWYTGSLPRTAWEDSSIYDKPHACYYNNGDDASFDVVGNTDGITIYYEHETGTDQVNAGGAVTAILATITSGDFDITQKRAKVDTRARARAVALKIENTAVSQDWKLGTFRLDIQPDGRR